MRTAECVHSLMHFLHMVSSPPPPIYMHALWAVVSTDFITVARLKCLFFASSLQTSRRTATRPRRWSGLWWASWWPPWSLAWRTGLTWRKPSKERLPVWIRPSSDSNSWQEDDSIKLKSGFTRHQGCNDYGDDINASTRKLMLLSWKLKNKR